MQPMFKVEMFIYQSKANLNVKVLFGEITHHLGPEMRKKCVRRVCMRRRSPSSILVHVLLYVTDDVYIYIYIRSPHKRACFVRTFRLEFNLLSSLNKNSHRLKLGKVLI